MLQELGRSGYAIEKFDKSHKTRVLSMHGAGHHAGFASPLTTLRGNRK